jgi:hypothetical protein
MPQKSLTVTHQSLYDLVWLKPMSELASRGGCTLTPHGHVADTVALNARHSRVLICAMNSSPVSVSNRHSLSDMPSVLRDPDPPRFERVR